MYPNSERMKPRHKHLPRHGYWNTTIRKLAGSNAPTV
jgi:hypothetical protein